MCNSPYYCISLPNNQTQGFVIRRWSCYRMNSVFGKAVPLYWKTNKDSKVPSSFSHPQRKLSKSTSSISNLCRLPQNCLKLKGFTDAYIFCIWSKHQHERPYLHIRIFYALFCTCGFDPLVSWAVGPQFSGVFFVYLIFSVKVTK